MIRYIVIDNYSGYIVADTDDPKSMAYRADDPFSICREIGGRLGGVRVSALGSRDKGCRVYAASDMDIRGYDSRNAHVIEAIEQECPLVMCVRFD